MRLLEHQSKRLLSSFGLLFSEAVVVDTPAAAAAEAERLRTPVVLKAQVPFGRRGKAGAIKFADTAERARRAASELLGLELRGHKVACISVEPKINFAREWYVGIAWDTIARLPVALLSVAGGVEVEASSSAQLAKRTFNPWVGLRAHKGREMAAQVGLNGRPLPGVGGVLEKLAQAFLSCDAILMEINPLVETTDGTLLGLDAHVEIDGDAIHRQRERLALLGQLAPTPTGRTLTR